MTGRRGGIEGIWLRDGLASLLLAPLGWLFAGVAALRNLAYDRGWFASQPLGLPCVSVGNLTVGGTGKTPMSAWVAQWFVQRGVRPAILLRGYGDDEPIVHQRLTPEAIVVANPDRLEGARIARERGAQVLVLDDAFQHRRAKRDVDLVLVAADDDGSHRSLPAGPHREGRGALKRAHAIIVTRKRATPEQAERALEWARHGAPRVSPVVVSLTPGELVRVAGGTGATSLPLELLKDARVLAISAIGDPSAFEAQLALRGARVESASYGDHHAFSDADVNTLTRRAGDADIVVCTLKDAVKLEGKWPRTGVPLWYLSQAVTVERGADVLHALLERLVTAVRS